MRSSYAINNYSAVFETIILLKRPSQVVELGILDGYSLLAMGKAIYKLRQQGHQCFLQGYDLFDDYTYNHGSQSDVEERIKQYSFQDFITVHKADAYQIHEQFTLNSIDVLHIDISNNGTTLKKMISNWTNILKPYGIILFEGGSEERDEISWMKLYNKIPIRTELFNNSIISNQYDYIIHTQFPSLTVLFKKN